MITELLAFIKSNQILAAGIGTVAFGSLMYLVKSIPLGAYRVVKRMVTVELMLMSENHLYHDVMEVLSRSRVRAFARLFTVSTRGDVIVGYGASLAVWRGRVVIFTRSVVEKDFRLIEKLEVTMLSRRTELLEQLIIAAKRPPVEPVIKVYQGGAGYFSDPVRKAKRSLSTVFCTGDKIGEIQRRIEWFLANEAWYLQRGIPYKLVVLLHGKPGCGKSSLIFALASEYNRNLGTITTVAGLGRTFANAPDNSFLVIEDIDMITVSREGEAKASDAQETPAREAKQLDVAMASALSALHVLINTLDGLSTPHGLILFITTNFKGRLDAALIRPGRVDVDAELEELDSVATGRMFLAFYGQQNYGLIKPYLDSAGFRPMAGADLQLVFTTESNPHLAVDRLRHHGANLRVVQ